MVIDKVSWHHGQCGMCDTKLTLLLHLNYDDPQNSFCICLKCLRENAQTIMYGWMEYNIDHTIDKLMEEQRR